MSQHYIFPQTKFSRQPGVAKQMLHILSEFLEIIVALLRGDLRHACHEAYDLIGSTETLIRKLYVRGRECGTPVYPAIIKLDVEAKNRKRGYYDE